MTLPKFPASLAIDLGRGVEEARIVYPVSRAGAQLPGTAAARRRIRLTHLYRLGRLPNFIEPTLVNDLVQVRKLTDRDARLPTLADKILVKGFATERIGRDRVIPTLWRGTALPAAPVWPVPFVVKSRHGCNQTAFVRTSNDDWPDIVRRSRRWTRSHYGRWLDEWLHANIEPGLLVEPMIGDGMILPLDYKLFVFGGRVEYVQVHLDREHDHRWIVFDRNWRRLTPGLDDARLVRPAALAAMIADAETLGADFDFVRVDLYEVDAKPMFGEMTFYPGSGLGAFDPPSLDAEMGAKWLEARTRMKR